MAKCPRCGEEMPLLSKVCTLCGHVDEGKGEDSMSADRFANTLDDLLHKMKSIPEPSFGKSMGQLSFIAYPLVALYMLVSALISEAGLFWILFLVFVVLSIVALVKKSKGRAGYAPFNRRFTELKNEYEHNERMGKRNYGKNIEVGKLLDDISTQIKTVEDRRRKVLGRNTMIWVVALVVIFALAGWGVWSLGKALNEPAQDGIEQTRY